MNKGKKLGPRRYGSGECALIVRELFENQAIVTLTDIQNATGCCRQTASRLLDTVSIFLSVYQVMEAVPYEYTKRRQGVQSRQYTTLKKEINND